MTSFLRYTETFPFDGPFETVNAFLETQNKAHFRVPITYWNNSLFRWLDVRDFWGEHHSFTFQAHPTAADDHTNVKIVTRMPFRRFIEHVILIVFVMLLFTFLGMIGWLVAIFLTIVQTLLLTGFLRMFLALMALHSCTALRSNFVTYLKKAED